MFRTINVAYLNSKLTTNDADVIMPVLKTYAEKCNHVTEMGVRDVITTWAILAAKPDKLVCIDWDNEKCPVNKTKLQEAKRLSAQEDILFEFIPADTTNISIEPTDLLFIDTWHTYEQLILELLMHSPNVNKYIICHDTNEDIFPGMYVAIEDFLHLNKNWKLVEKNNEFPGYTIIERVFHIENRNEYNKDVMEWGWLDKNALLREINLQKQLYFEDYSKENGPGGKKWEEYVEFQYDKFKERQK